MEAIHEVLRDSKEVQEEKEKRKKKEAGPGFQRDEPPAPAVGEKRKQTILSV